MEKIASFIGVKEDLLKIFDYFKKNPKAMPTVCEALVLFRESELGSVLVNHGKDLTINVYSYINGTIIVLLKKEREYKICFLPKGEVTCHDASEEETFAAETLLKGWIEKLKEEITA